MSAFLLFNLSAGATTTQLNTLSLADMEQGWGEPSADVSVIKHSLTVAGTAFAHGIGTHANSRWALQLDGQSSSFTGSVGVDDGCGGKPFLRFTIEGDGKPLWKSRELTTGQPAQNFTVDLTGVKTLVLSVSAKGSNKFAHADWLDPIITHSGSAPRPLSQAINIRTNHLIWRINCGTEMPIQRQFGPASQADRTEMPSTMVHPQELTRFDNPRTFLHPTLSVLQGNGNTSTYLHYLRHEQRALDANRIQTDIVLEDATLGMEVILHYVAYQQEDIISAWTTYTNHGEKDVTLLRMASCLFGLSGEDLNLTTFTGKWAHEMQWSQLPLQTGVLEFDTKTLTHPTTPMNPSFLLSRGPAQEESGWVLAGSLAWTGNWQLAFDTTPDHLTAVSGGLNPNQPYVLRAKTSLETPPLLLTASDSGVGQTSRNFHHWARHYGLAHAEKTRPVILNSWDGALFNFDEKRLVAMMDGAAAIGCEMFVLDDGWFGNKYPRNSDNAGLGDWETNHKKLPHDLQWLADQAKQRGLRFGLWVEPEMVNPKSELFEKHPEWVCQIPGREMRFERSQVPLDMANPEVQEFAFQSVANLLSKNPGISYIKWDNNGQVTEPGSPYLGPDGQSRFPVEFVRGYYQVIKRLRERFPEIEFQACASGGGRVDYGALPYHAEYWASDNQNPLIRLGMLWGYSHFFPPFAAACHIAETFNSKDYSLKFRMDVAMTARLGVELDPSHLNAEDIATLHSGIDAYKHLRPLLHSGDLYRGVAPQNSPLTTSSIVSADRTSAVFFAFHQDKDAKAGTETVRIPGLDPAKTYQLTEINPADQPRVAASSKSGRELSETGLAIQWPAGCQSAVIELTESKP